MRKLFISLLLASAAATPALAAPREHWGRDSARAERSERQEAREEARSERAVQVERPQFVGGNHADRSTGGGEQPVLLRQHVQPNGDRGQPQVQALRSPTHVVSDGVRNWRGPRHDPVIDQDQAVQDRRERFGDRDRFDNGALRHSDRPLPQVMRTRVPVISTIPRPGTQPPLRLENRRHDTVRWTTDWRRDNRYDWRRWRDRHQSWFNLGIYYDPFGWGYQPYSIGWRMWPSYYSSRYWINDPWQYRLPYAPPGYRWVRYWDDAILVDEWTGEVADVINNFFW